MSEQPSPLHILLLEDNALTIALVRRQLEEALSIPYNLVQDDTLQTALERLDALHFDIALIDLNVEDSEGLETFRQIRHDHPEIPILILSSEADEETAVTAVREGADDYLVKNRYDAHHLARAIRFCYERSQRIHAEREVHAAARVQRSLYPGQDPQIDGYDIAGAAYPAVEASGDYYDFVLMQNGSLGIALGDASGHGLGPAMRMAQTRAYVRALTDTWTHIRSLARAYVCPGDVLTHLNRLLVAETKEGFISLFFSRLDPREKRLVYASAGHEGYLIRGNEPLSLKSTGTTLGVIEEEVIQAAAPIDLKAGDILLLPTDGIDETMNPEGTEQLGRQRMLEVVMRHSDQSASQIVQALYNGARAFAQGMPQRDDITAIVIKVLA